MEEFKKKMRDTLNETDEWNGVRKESRKRRISDKDGIKDNKIAEKKDVKR